MSIFFEKESFFNKIIIFDSINSTNSELMNNNNYDDKTLIYTFNQTAGRGRLDRKWLDFSNKNLALSVLLKNIENISINYHIWITAVLAISVVEILEYFGINNSFIKWQNDVFIDDKKISGILTESKWSGNKFEKIVTGVGININTTKEDFINLDRKVTSVYLEKELIINIMDFTDKFIKTLSKYFYILFSNEGVSKIRENWKKKSAVIGKKAFLTNILGLEEKTIEGIIKDIDKEGYLYLETNNETIKITTGDIILR